jgi:predicted DNA-binding transcriptional regulator YafY
MRKVDRLFVIIQLLRGQRLQTAEFISEKLGVSVRTVYRDIHGLIASGIPIEGERGIGYVIRQSIELPPLHFSPLELQAIQLGINMVKAVADHDVAAAAKEVAIKIQDALPAKERGKTFAPLAHIYFESDTQTRDVLAKLRCALDEKNKLKIIYTNKVKKKSSRIVRPLGLEYWGKVWTLTAWCECRDEFRVFRVDKISFCEITGDVFKTETGKTYRDYLAHLSERIHE